MSIPPNVPHKNLYGYNREAARHFFLDGGPHFRHICEMAGRNPAYVQAKIRKVILRKKGWNVDVPAYSHYRQGPKKRKPKYRKKHLTGNAYYAKKAGKEMKKRNIYYQGMGA